MKHTFMILTQFPREGSSMKYKQYTFTMETEAIQMDQFMKRYHFDGKDQELLRATGRFLAEIITVKAGICFAQEKAVCVVTLGERFDHIADVVAESGHLLLEYALECFGMEFLSKSYEKLNETVFGEIGQWLGTYRFLGDAELEAMKTYLASFQELSVYWKQGMLRPLKSVVFEATYQRKQEDSGCHNCEQCDNVTCSFRKVVQKGKRWNEQTVQERKSNAVYSYGISRILGKK